jgi:hypothetical protein
MRVIQVPMSEIVWPPKKRRKLRWRSARQACDEPLNSRGESEPGDSADCAPLFFSVLLRIGSSEELEVHFDLDRNRHGHTIFLRRLEAILTDCFHSFLVQPHAQPSHYV